MAQATIRTDIMKRIVFQITLLFIACSFHAKGQNIYLQENNGSHLNRDIVSLQKIIFSDENLIMTYKDQTIETFDLASITKIYFDSTTYFTDFELTEQTLIYFNPADNYIYLRNKPEKQTLYAIYRLNGSMVKSGSLDLYDDCIDASDISSGLYFVRIGNKTQKIRK